MNLNSVFANLADRWVQPLLNRLNQRASMWPLGIFPVRSGAPIERVIIDGKQVELRFPQGEREAQAWELNHLWIDDPYDLRKLQAHSSHVRTIADIGGNIGFFSVLARRCFPDAVIHCYEPNPLLAPVILHNTVSLDIKVHHEGVGLSAGSATLEAAGNTLCGTLQAQAGGTIPITPIAEVIARLGGTIDLAKLDCEGGEWDIFEDTASLKRIKFLALEYHLELRPSKTVAGLVKLLNDAGFHIDALKEASNPAVGLLQATNRQLLG